MPTVLCKAQIGAGTPASGAITVDGLDAGVSLDMLLRELQAYTGKLPLGASDVIATLLAQQAARVSAALALALIGTGALFSAAVQAQRADPPADAAATAVAPAASKRRAARCEVCGVVESIRRVEAAANVPASWEFSVRMRDGSIRLSTSESVGGWRHGDAILLIGGPAASRT